MRAEQQPFVDYLTAIQNLADACEFAEKENMFRDKIVFCVASQAKALKERLLRQEILTLTKTRDLCVAFEVTHNEVRSMSIHDTQSTTEKAVNYVKRRRVKQDTKSTPFSQHSNQDTRHLRTTTGPPPVQTNTSYADAAEPSMKRASAQRTARRVTSSTDGTTTQQFYKSKLMHAVTTPHGHDEDSREDEFFVHPVVKMCRIVTTRCIVFMVPVITEKLDGSLRLCLDPKHINKNTRREHFQIPTFTEISTQLGGARLFIILDQKDSYWQVELDEDSSLLCCFNTPFGRYRFVRMPFGITSASEVLQKWTYKTFGDIPNVHIVAYDMLIAMKIEAEHENTLRKVMERARGRCVKFNMKKTQLKKSEVGKMISADGMRPDDAKIKAIVSMPQNQQAKISTSHRHAELSVAIHTEQSRDHQTTVCTTQGQCTVGMVA